MVTELFTRGRCRRRKASAPISNGLAIIAGAAGLWRGVFGYCSSAVAGLVAALVLVVYLAFANVLSHQGYYRATLAKPVLPSVSWEQRVADFGDRLSDAFGLAPGRALEFAGWILEAADRQRLDAELIASLLQVESGFRKNIRSQVGAIGPAQVRPRFWSEFCGGDDLTDPAYNIHCGAQVLAHLKRLCGGAECALAAYNVGMYSTRKQAARRYVSKIDHQLLQLKTL